MREQLSDTTKTLIDDPQKCVNMLRYSTYSGRNILIRMLLYSHVQVRLQLLCQGESEETNCTESVSRVNSAQISRKRDVQQYMTIGKTGICVMVDLDSVFVASFRNSGARMRAPRELNINANESTTRKRYTNQVLKSATHNKKQ